MKTLRETEFETFKCRTFGAKGEPWFDVKTLSPSSAAAIYVQFKGYDPSNDVVTVRKYGRYKVTPRSFDAEPVK